MTKELRRPGARNPNIELMRFVYIWCIVLYHFYRETEAHFPGGYYGVNYFLLAAGVFFFRSLERHEDMRPSAYVYKRFMRFIPWTLTAFVFAYIVRRIMIAPPESLRELGLTAVSDLWEMLLVKVAIVTNGASFVNAPTWTVSAMFLVEMVMVNLAYADKKRFVHALLPVTLLVGVGCWTHADTADWDSWSGVLTYGIIRTWVVYGAGYYCLRFSQKLAGIPFSRLGKLLLTVLESLCHVFSIAAILYTANRQVQLCSLLSFFIAVAVALSGHSLWTEVLERFSGAIGFLGAYSLSLYLIHRPISRYFEMLYPKPAEMYTHLAACMAITVALSLAHYFMVKGMLRFWRSRRQKLMAPLLQEAGEKDD